MRTTDQIAREREHACLELEDEIRRLGVRFQRYVELTAELGVMSGQDFTNSLDNPISMLLGKAGLSRFLALKLAGLPGHLDEIAAQSHRARLGRT